MNTISPIRLVVADDQPVIMRGLGLILNTDEGVEVVGHAKDGYEVVELAKEHTPDIIIMDLQMPGQSGVAATRQITALNPDIRVVVLTTFDHDNLVFDAIRAGAQAYLLKDATESELLNTIEQYTVVNPVCHRSSRAKSWSNSEKTIALTLTIVTIIFQTRAHSLINVP